jgi:hypothetical protein
VDNDEVTPFSTLRTVRRFLLDTVASTAGYGNLHWAGNERSQCSYKGHTFETSKVQLMAQTMLDRAEELLWKKVLKSLLLLEIGYEEPEYLTLRDQKVQRANHYSVWNDPTNISLHTQREKLLTAFTSRPNLEFCSDVLPNGDLEWRNDRRMGWLTDVKDFIECLALCTHMYGGQARRAKEFCGMRVQNIEARIRDLFLHGNDLLFIIGYSKTASITLRDRMDAHALPPRLTRLFFILNTLVRPLVVLWTKELLDPAYIAAKNYQSNEENQQDGSSQVTDEDEDDEREGASLHAPVDMELDEEPSTEDTVAILGQDEDSPEYDDDALDGSEFEVEIDELMSDTEERSPRSQLPAMKPSRIQSIYAFASLGSVLQPERFGDLLGKTTKEFLGVELRVQGWRHVSIAIQRDLIGLVDDLGSRPVNTVFDAQAAHSGQVSKTYYAVSESDRALVGAGSIEKYVKASQLWHDWLNGCPTQSSTK